MNTTYPLLPTKFSFGRGWGLWAFLAVFGFFLFAPMETTQAQNAVAPGNFAAGSHMSTTKFNALRTQMQGFAVVVLLIMLVIAAIMAAMQKVTMAINVAIAAIILFGGGYIMLLIYDGLK